MFIIIVQNNDMNMWIKNVTPQQLKDFCIENFITFRYLPDMSYINRKWHFRNRHGNYWGTIWEAKNWM